MFIIKMLECHITFTFADWDSFSIPVFYNFIQFQSS